MTHRIYRTCGLAVMLVCPFTALADTTGTPTLATGQELNLSTGAVGSSGGDIQWMSGTGMVMLNGAKNFDFPGNESAEYSSLTLAVIQAELGAVTPSTSPIPASALVVGNLFVVESGGGAYAKVLVTAVSGTSITIQFDTFNPTSGGGGGGTGGGSTPSITAVLDAGSYSSSLAPGSVFVVKGSNLSPTGIGSNGVFSTSYPLPQSSNGVSINFTPASGGAMTQAYIVYLYNSGGVNQLAGILPSTVTPGNYNVTVANGGQTSSGVVVKVVAIKPGLVTRDSSGSGLAVIQNYNTTTSAYDIDSFTTGSVGGSTISPGHPNQIMIAWLTGMGAVPFADNTAPNNSQGYDFTKNGVTVLAYVGGVSVPAAFGGRTGCCAGEDEIVFTLPSTVTTGCTVSFQVSVNGVLSQTTFISIASTGAAACDSPVYTTSQLQAFDNGTTSYSGTFSLSTLNESAGSLGNFTVYGAAGAFNSTTGFELPYTSYDFASITSGTCIVAQILPNLSNTVTTTVTRLDAGQITLTGPSASTLNGTALPEISNEYDLSISGPGSSGNGSIVPGTYTLRGSGGHDVGSFSATVTLGPALVITGGLPTSITRSAGLTLNWTGGNSTDSVVILGEAATGSSPNETGASFECFTTAGKGTFTVPAAILNQLPAISAAQIANMSGLGVISVLSGVQASSGDGLFNAPLTAGGSINNATFTGNTDIIGEAAYQ